MLLHVESDCIFAVESVQRIDAYLGLDVAIIMECKKLAIDFTKVCYVHGLHEANEVVGGLANNSFSTRSSSFWDTSIPDFVSHSLVDDMSIIQGMKSIYRKKNIDLYCKLLS